MSGNKTLPGASFRFASVSSSGSHTNEYGVGEIFLGMYRPGYHWPQIDLGQIYFSDPTPEQFEAAKTKHRMPDIDGKNFVDINRRISRKQADYISYLITSMLAEKLKAEMPTDDEIDVIMKDLREANYPVNRQKRKEEENWELTEQQVRLLGRLRAKAASKNIPINLCFESETSGYIAFTRPGGKFSISFIVGEGLRDGLNDAVMQAIYQIEQVKTSDQITQVVDDQKSLNDLIETTKKRYEGTSADRVLGYHKTLTDYKDQSK